MKTRHDFFGYLAELHHQDELLHLAKRAHEAGFRRMEAYSPYPIEGLHEALGHRKTILPLMVLLGGFFGAVVGFGMQYYASVIAYPLNVGGRPLNSWPAFIPVTFEMTILCAAITAVIGMIGLNGLPKPYHPVFHIDQFQLASRDRFFLCIESKDPRFDAEKTKNWLTTNGARQVFKVPY